MKVDKMIAMTQKLVDKNVLEEDELELQLSINKQKLAKLFEDLCQKQQFRSETHNEVLLTRDKLSQIMRDNRHDKIMIRSIVVASDIDNEFLSTQSNVRIIALTNNIDPSRITWLTQENEQ